MTWPDVNIARGVSGLMYTQAQSSLWRNSSIRRGGLLRYLCGMATTLGVDKPQFTPVRIDVKIWYPSQAWDFG